MIFHIIIFTPIITAIIINNYYYVADRIIIKKNSTIITINFSRIIIVIIIIVHQVLSVRWCAPNKEEKRSFLVTSVIVPVSMGTMKLASFGCTSYLHGEK